MPEHRPSEESRWARAFTRATQRDARIDTVAWTYVDALSAKRWSFDPRAAGSKLPSVLLLSRSHCGADRTAPSASLVGSGGNGALIRFQARSVPGKCRDAAVVRVQPAFVDNRNEQGAMSRCALNEVPPAIVG